MNEVKITKPDFQQIKEILIELISDVSKIEEDYAMQMQGFLDGNTKLTVVSERISNKDELKKYILEAFTK